MGLRKSASLMVRLVRKSEGKSEVGPNSASEMSDCECGISGRLSAGSIKPTTSLTAVEHLMTARRTSESSDTEECSGVQSSESQGHTNLRRTDTLRHSKCLDRTAPDLSAPELETACPRAAAARKNKGSLRLAGEVPIEQLEAMRLAKVREHRREVQLQRCVDLEREQNLTTSLSTSLTLGRLDRGNLSRNRSSSMHSLVESYGEARSSALRTRTETLAKEEARRRRRSQTQEFMPAQEDKVAPDLTVVDAELN